MYEIVYKTNKTNKTEAFQRLEKWFSTVDIKPIKPECNKEDFSLVFYGPIIPLYREVLTVFSVFTAFLREIDKDRYKKYYEDFKPELKDGSIETFISSEEDEALNDKIKIRLVYTTLYSSN